MRSSYRTNNRHRFNSASRIDKKVWNLLWRSGLHEKHKLLAWKILHGVVPTKDRTKSYIPQADLSCYLCSSYAEYIDHLIFECPIAALCWLKSSWQLRIAQFASFGRREMDHSAVGRGQSIPYQCGGETKDAALWYNLI